MTKNNLKLLDMDEHLRCTHEKQHSELITFCKRYGLVLDLASSDVVAFIEDKNGNSIGIE